MRSCMDGALAVRSVRLGQPWVSRPARLANGAFLTHDLWFLIDTGNPSQYGDHDVGVQRIRFRLRRSWLVAAMTSLLVLLSAPSEAALAIDKQVAFFKADLSLTQEGQEVDRFYDPVPQGCVGRPEFPGCEKWASGDLRCEGTGGYQATLVTPSPIKLQIGLVKRPVKAGGGRDFAFGPPDAKLGYGKRTPLAGEFSGTVNGFYTETTGCPEKSSCALEQPFSGSSFSMFSPLIYGTSASTPEDDFAVNADFLISSISGCIPYHLDGPGLWPKVQEPTWETASGGSVYPELPKSKVFDPHVKRIKTATSFAIDVISPEISGTGREELSFEMVLKRIKPKK